LSRQTGVGWKRYSTISVSLTTLTLTLSPPSHKFLELLEIPREKWIVILRLAGRDFIATQAREMYVPKYTRVFAPPRDALLDVRDAVWEVPISFPVLSFISFVLFFFFGFHFLSFLSFVPPFFLLFFSFFLFSFSVLPFFFLFV